VSDRTYTRTEMSRLAALSRAYHEALDDIVSVLVQELRQDEDPEWRDDVTKRFGLSVPEVTQFQADHVKRLYYGYIHRAGLMGAPQVYARVLQDIELGRLKAGDQLPARTVFTVKYHCDKRTHAEVVDRLVKNGVVHRPGGNGGPLFVM